MAAGIKILLICNEENFSSHFKEQLFDLGKHLVAVELTFQAAALSLSKSICDLVFVKYAIPEAEIGSRLLELRKVDSDCTVKASALTALEWEQIKMHPAIGAKILEHKILEPLTFLNGVVDLIRQHHEHYDGTGYPEGRKGDDILLGARIIHVADAYEAMRSARSYRQKPLFKEEAILEIRRNRGIQFDPKIVDVFLKVVNNL